ncbi:hypothetical protein AB4Z10_04130 [Bosea sp. RAF48]|uniref:hypothetical protein n=1 Tax=Bosea sp. RAF48 TaxID=3237480 RepID=UPI003F900FD8
MPTIREDVGDVLLGDVVAAWVEDLMEGRAVAATRPQTIAAWRWKTHLSRRSRVIGSRKIRS